MITFLFLDGNNCEEISEELKEVYKDQSPSMATIRYWFNKCKRDRKCVFDKDRPGRPIIEVSTDDDVQNKIHDVV